MAGLRRWSSFWSVGFRPPCHQLRILQVTISRRAMADAEGEQTPWKTVFAQLISELSVPGPNLQQQMPANS